MGVGVRALSPETRDIVRAMSTEERWRLIENELLSLVRVLCNAPIFWEGYDSVVRGEPRHKPRWDVPGGKAPTRAEDAAAQLHDVGRQLAIEAKLPRPKTSRDVVNVLAHAPYTLTMLVDMLLASNS